MKAVSIRQVAEGRVGDDKLPFLRVFRDLPADFRIGADPNARGDIFAEFALYYRLGIDGVFSDHPDTAVAARVGFPK